MYVTSVITTAWGKKHQMKAKKYKISLPEVVSDSELRNTGYVWREEAQIIARNIKTQDYNS